MAEGKYIINIFIFLKFMKVKIYHYKCIEKKKSKTDGMIVHLRMLKMVMLP